MYFYLHVLPFMRVKKIQRLFASHGNYEQQKREMKTNHWDTCFQDQCSLKLLKYFPGPFEQNKSSKHINNCVKWDWPQCIGCCRRAGRFGRGGWGSVQMMGCCDDWLVKEGPPRLQNSNTAGNYPLGWVSERPMPPAISESKNRHSTHKRKYTVRNYSTMLYCTWHLIYIIK